jgi:acetyl-CoA acyltransferase 2
MSGIFLVAAKRTPFGAFGGSLKGFSATDLGVAATQAALASSPNLDPAAVDSVYFGNVIQSSPDAAYLARHVALKSGCQIQTPSLTINRLCGSGFETLVLASQSIRAGDAQISICGGAENMSNAPLQVAGNHARWGVKLGGGLAMRDALWDGLTDSYANTPMGVTAENLAKKYNITREVSDADDYDNDWMKYRILTLEYGLLSSFLGMRRLCFEKSTSLGQSQGGRSL